MSTSTTGPAMNGSAGPMELTHRALMYRGSDELVTLTAREIHGALAVGRPVLAALPTAHLSLVRRALEADEAQVQWVDMAEAGRNPGRILPGVLTAFQDAHGDQPVTMVGEPIWPGRNGNEYAAAVAHEALINLAFAGREVSIVCPYDAEGLSHDALQDAHRTHPEILDRRGTRASEDYLDPAAVAVEACSRLGAPSPDAVALQLHRPEELYPARQVLRVQAVQLGATEDDAERFTLACHEAIANALRHGGGEADVQLWRDGFELVCQVDSPGGFGDLLAGRRNPAPSSDSGRGLVMINEICDLVLLHATERGATIQMRTATNAG